ncbi:DUF2269 domain-containing protein [Chitinimonas arctica]|uniref:DUF2269 domain-containing protein n=1 Tax=Chitinimonas arctica TaxID=2594795 RepID=A0A516SEH7_9NEIS|nr:DUF2269 domain-containing protein [Chitinimonas arctica]
MDYLALKWLHILSATFLFGTGFGTAFYMFVANRSGNVQAIAVVSRWVVRADWWFTTPAVIVQPLSGYALIRLAGFPLDAYWIVTSLALYALAGICWLPVVWLQLRMRDMAAQAARDDTALPPRYWFYERCWTALGFPAFGALLVVYWLMVHKPM